MFSIRQYNCKHNVLHLWLTIVWDQAPGQVNYDTAIQKGSKTSENQVILALKREDTCFSCSYGCILLWYVFALS